MCGAGAGGVGEVWGGGGCRAGVGGVGRACGGCVAACGGSDDAFDLCCTGDVIGPAPGFSEGVVPAAGAIAQQG